MLNGIHCNYTKSIFGTDLWDDFINEILCYGKKVLLVFGNISERQELLKQRLEKDLSSIETWSITGVTADPDALMVYRGIELVKKNSIDHILAIGGGSVIDTAKAIGIGAKVSFDFFDFFDGKARPNSMLPVGVLLTISGAGSESSDGAVITKDNKKLSCGAPNMYPHYVYIDPSLQLTVPENLVSCGIYDSITHVMERYFSSTKNVETTSALAIALFRNIIELGVKVNNNLYDPDLRGDLIWAQKLAHDNTVGFGRKQCWATHTISHEIGVRTKETHGEILSVLFPAWMSFIATEQPETIAKFGREAFNVDTKNSLVMQCEDTVFSLKEFSKTLGLATTFTELGHDLRDQFQSIANACSRTTQSGTIGNFRRLSIDDIEKILEIANC